MSQMYSLLPLADGSTHAHTSVWVAAILRQEISEGRLLPGCKLSEQALSAALGVSRNTLREGFALLAHDLIITRIPNRGVFVAAPDCTDISEIYAVRRTIEPAALAWGPNLDLGELQEIMREARAASDAQDAHRMANANQQFHEAIVRAAGSEHLSELMGRILARMRLVFHQMRDAPQFHTHYVAQNSRLVELLSKNQRMEAANALRLYLDAAQAELLAHYQSSQPA